jgi:hypothetical protein
VDKVSFSTEISNILLGKEALRSHGWKGGNFQNEVLQVLSTPLKASHPQLKLSLSRGTRRSAASKKYPNAQQPKGATFKPFGRYEMAF